jgi:hypothetical protein
MRLSTGHIRFVLPLLILIILLPACGGSSNDSTPSNPDTTNPTDGDNNNTGDTNEPGDGDEPGDDPLQQDPSILKVSDIRTQATPETPITVFNQAGDGIAVWSVTSTGSWLYYSLYDQTSGRWSQAEQLAPVDSNGYPIKPQAVSNGTGFAVAWNDWDYNLFVSLINQGEIHTTQVADSEDYSDWDYRLVTNSQGYLIIWATGQPSNELYSMVSHNGDSWDETTSLYIPDEPTRLDIGPVSANHTGYAVTFSEYDQPHLLGRVFDGSTWHDTESLLNASDGYAATSNPILASNGEGYSLVWTGYTEQSATIMNRVYTDSGGWSQNHNVATYNNSDRSLVYANRIVSNGTGYCVSVLTNWQQVVEAIIDTQGDGQWGSATPLKTFDSALRQITLVSDGEGYALLSNRHVYLENSYVEGTLYYDASIYRNGAWTTTATPLASIPSSNIEWNPYYDRDTPIATAGLNGDYVIALFQHQDGSDSVNAIRFDSDSGWSEIESLENDPGAATTPVVAANPQGGISVVWHQVDDDRSDLSTYRNQLQNAQWHGKELMFAGDYRLGSSYDPQIITDDNGATLAVWSQDRNGYQALFATIRDGDQWRQPIVLSDAITETPVKMASHASGFAITWEEQASDNSYRLKAIVFDTLAWRESLAHSTTLIHQSTQQISMALTSNSSDYQLLYVDTVGEAGTKNLIARQYDGASWREPATIAETIYSYSGHPQIATNGSTYRTAWVQRDGESMNIYSSQFDGTSWSQRQTVASDLELIAIHDYWYGYPDVARVTSNGEGYGIFWFDGGRAKSRFYSGDSWLPSEDIGTISVAEGFACCKKGEAPRVVSNGTGYVAVWRSTSETKSALYANIYDGTAWRGAANLNISQSSEILFDMAGHSNQLVVSGDQYGVVWGSPYYLNETAAGSTYARIYDGSEWIDATPLNRNMAEITHFQLAGDDEGFLAAWLQQSIDGQIKLITKRYNGSHWDYREIVDDNNLNKYDLSLLGSTNGYQAIWTSAEQGHDPWVRVPWVKSGL